MRSPPSDRDLFRRGSLREVGPARPAGGQMDKAQQHPERAKAIVDTEISAMVREVSPDSIKNHIARMVRFGTRHSI